MVLRPVLIENGVGEMRLYYQVALSRGAVRWSWGVCKFRDIPL